MRGTSCRNTSTGSFLPRLGKLLNKSIHLQDGPGTGCDRAPKYGGVAPVNLPFLTGPAPANMCKVLKRPEICGGRPGKPLPTSGGQAAQQVFPGGCRTLPRNLIRDMPMKMIWCCDAWAVWPIVYQHEFLCFTTELQVLLADLKPNNELALQAAGCTGQSAGTRQDLFKRLKTSSLLPGSMQMHNVNI